ncbi:hypothetical protein LCGC14_1172380 [marine sediment metagenome]|uniref:Uncharacterized protein n=1 Tax=marine sediment metagenome TaxID=412755 RepID=A0A0F9LPI5_9ZZZZ
MEKSGRELVVKETGEIVQEAPLVTLTEMSIANIAHNVAMAERLVTTLLEKEIDYGRTPGTQTDGLWDAGAAKIFAGFNCYVDHQVLFHDDEEKLISWCIQANIISRATQTIVGTGVGAASTRESKNKYRWVANPRELGYGDDEIAKLKRRASDGKFRVINPDYGDLVNTLFLMAAKRAEVDGARSMPGVGGALKKLFEHKLKGKPRETGIRKLDYSGYWGKINQMGLTEKQSYAHLGVDSLNGWIDNGGTLETALEKIVASVAKSKTETAQQAGAERKDAPERIEADFQNTIDLLHICSDDFGMSSTDVFKELSFQNQAAYDASGDKPFESYLTIKSLRGAQPEESVEEQS